jgi:hypothetical protein
MGQYAACGFFFQGKSFNQGMAIAPVLEIIVGPTDYPAITEIGIGTSSNASNAQPIGIGVASSQGVGPQYICPPFGAYDLSNQPGGLSIATSWQKPPGVPTKYLRRAVILGAGTSQGTTPLVFRFPRGLRLAPSSSLVVTFTASSTTRVGLGEFWVEYDN